MGRAYSKMTVIIISTSVATVACLNTYPTDKDDSSLGVGSTPNKVNL